MNKELQVISRICVSIVFLTMSALLSYAKPKSLGAVFSFTGISISYEHQSTEYDAFIEISVKAESSEMFLGRCEDPGISGSLTLNFPIVNWKSCNGNDIVFFAGPGIAAGYAKDYKLSSGLFFGLKGRAGFECSFSRNVVISAFISPIIGSHIEIGGEAMTLKYYRNGVIYSLVPEIGIKYRF